jgi:uncharacterized membrane protein
MAGHHPKEIVMSVTRPAPRPWMATLLLAAAFGAQAATVTVTCEKRADRSKISVDAAGLARGNYYAVAESGATSAQSAPEAARRGEVQVDFDSNPRDIARGATAIAADFIVDGKVTGTIYTLAGAEVGTATATCRIRN